MKYKLHTIANRVAPGGEFELEDDRIATTANDCGVAFPWERNTAGKLFVVGNEYGALGAVWARHDGDAIDELIDRDLAGGLLVDEPKDEKELAEYEEFEYAQGGNAGEWWDPTHAWIAEVDFQLPRDRELVVKLAEARGANASLLSEV